jgi:hypothetical protein
MVTHKRAYCESQQTMTRTGHPNTVSALKGSKSRNMGAVMLRKTNLMHNSFLVYFVNLYMFRAYLGPSLGGTTICIQQLVIIIPFRRLSVVLVGMESSKMNNKYQLLYTHGCTS